MADDLSRRLEYSFRLTPDHSVRFCWMLLWYKYQGEGKGSLVLTDVQFPHKKAETSLHDWEMIHDFASNIDYRISSIW